MYSGKISSVCLRAYLCAIVLKLTVKISMHVKIEESSPPQAKILKNIAIFTIFTFGKTKISSEYKKISQNAQPPALNEPPQLGVPPNLNEIFSTPPNMAHFGDPSTPPTRVGGVQTMLGGGWVQE